MCSISLKNPFKFLPKPILSLKNISKCLAFPQDPLLRTRMYQKKQASAARNSKRVEAAINDDIDTYTYGKVTK